jgi:hypothetical protein
LNKFVWMCGLAAAVFAVLCFGQVAAKSKNKAGPQNPPQGQPVLSADDKVEIGAALRLKIEAGDQVWPGLAGADIPLILFDGRYEFLIGEEKPSGPWETVPGDDFDGRPYFRRAVNESQYFAVKIGMHYAGSAGTLGKMNSESPLKLSPDMHIVMVLHEMFHAYEGDQAPARMTKALAVYKAEGRYPYKDKDFAKAWTNEGAALAQALRATDDAEAVQWAKKFWQTREARRRTAGFGPELLDYERELEWLEGLAEYAEIRFHELAARLGPTSSIKFAPSLPVFLQYDFVRLEKQLGAQEGDLRFYVSGMAQARLLDRLSPGWKTKATLDKFYLEDLVRAAAFSRAR